MPVFHSSGGGGGYDYVQDGEPTDAVEGEEWYDTGADAAYVFTGTAWVEQTVVDHGQLSGVGASDHHSRPTSTQNTSTNTDTAFAQFWSGHNSSDVTVGPVVCTHFRVRCVDSDYTLDWWAALDSVNGRRVGPQRSRSHSAGDITEIVWNFDRPETVETLRFGGDSNTSYDFQASHRWNDNHGHSI